jgi:hypothetical protein
MYSTPKIQASSKRKVTWTFTIVAATDPILMDQDMIASLRTADGGLLGTRAGVASAC